MRYQDVRCDPSIYCISSNLQYREWLRVLSVFMARFARAP